MSVSSVWTVSSPWVAAYTMIVGAACGSFIGVVVERIPRGKSVVWPGSHCDSCHRAIAWYDNVPLVSFLLLRGRCRYCRTAIGWRALWLEWAAALLFLALSWNLPTYAQIALWLPASLLLLAITCIDIDYFWVPDVLVVPLALWALLVRLILARESLPEVMAGVLPAVGLWLLAWLYLHLRRKEALGLGDIKLLAALGLALGWKGAALSLMLGSLQGAAVGLMVVALGGHRQRQMPIGVDPADDDGWQPDPHAIPFGPFLALAALEVVLVPEPIAHAYQWMITGMVRVLGQLFDVL